MRHRYLRVMKEYQTVIARLTRHVREDEDALTDLLNERSRGGWSPSMMAQDGDRLTLIFERDTPSGDAASTAIASGMTSSAMTSNGTSNGTSNSMTSGSMPAIEPPAAE